MASTANPNMAGSTTGKAVQKVGPLVVLFGGSSDWWYEPARKARKHLEA